MTYRSLNIAMIGFEFKHHIQAFIKAIQRVNEIHVDVIPVIWLARDGVKADIIKNFPSCEFLDGALGWFGEFGKNTKLLYEDKITLSDIEIKHFSYAYSRTRFLRDPRKITKKDKLLFARLVNFAMTLLCDTKVDKIFFVKLPHKMLDLAFLYAARRLNIDFVYTDGPFYGNDYVFLRSDEIPSNKVKSEANIYRAFKNVMEERNLKNHLSLPHYQRADLSYMAKIPKSSTPFFKKKKIQILYTYIKSRKIATLVDLVIDRILIFTSRIVRKVLLERWVRPPGKKYILVLLQYHPEQTTSPSAADTPFEEERAIALAELFPHYQIVMREHPSNLKSSSYLSYRNPFLINNLLRNHKNISYQVPSDRKSYGELIENAFFTVSTSGTVAFESILLGVPSIHFYNSFARGFPGVHIVNDAAMIREKMIQLSRKNLNKFDVEGIINACYEVVCLRKLERGFLCGYHEYIYTNREYIENASEIIYESLIWLLSDSRHKTT